VEQHLPNLYDLVVCMTNAVDLVSPEVAKHHQRVAYLAFKIAEHLGLSFEEKKSIVLAGLLHDVGALSLDDRLELIEREPLTAENHAYIGAGLLQRFSYLEEAAEIIRYHHVPWAGGAGRTFRGNQVPVASHILHLADRIAVQVDLRTNVIGQIGAIRESIREKKNTIFMPELVDAFCEMSAQEYIWLDIVYKPLLSTLPDFLTPDTLELNLDEVMGLTKIFANIIDFRSPFTARHSAGVAGTAEKLAELSGFSENECKMMRIAGNLHDLGKLAVSKEVLEKPDKLDPSEFNAIRSHTFYTYRLLQSIKGFEIINQWASFHHEKLSGKGYPFHLQGSGIPLGSRIMAVADVFTAITEDRPYRAGMSDGETAAVLDSMVKNNSICPQAVALLMDNYETINDLRCRAEETAALDYQRIIRAPED